MTHAKAKGRETAKKTAFLQPVKTVETTFQPAKAI